MPGYVAAPDVETTDSDIPAGRPVADAVRSLPSVSASVAPTVTSGERESLYCTFWLPPASEFVATGNAWMVKLAFETSKKMFPTASILRRACVAPTFGRGTDSEPSFAVLAARTCGDARPPSGGRLIFTVAGVSRGGVGFA